jgi:23S rRNA (adenine2030-N6)-methyltransferase
LADYLGVVRTLGLYPGSPAIVLALLRANDRLAACELHPDDATLLRRRIGADPRAGVHHRDGYEAVRALLPPPERRALVLIDPPYEQPDEFDQIAEAIITARARCAPSVIATWYPIKHRAPVRAFHDRLRDMGLRDLVAAELLLREPLDPARLNGSGMLVATPPYRFETEVAPILDALLAGLGDGEPGAGARIERLADE